MQEKRSRGRATQQGVQVRELAALALETHPGPFSGVVAARPVQQEEDIAAACAVLLVELFDATDGPIEQRTVRRQGGFTGIDEIGQQAEMQVGIAIGQEADFQRFGHVVDGLCAREHRRHDDQRSCFRWNSGAIVHARQRTRRRDQRHQPVDERQRQLAGAQYDEHPAQSEQPTVRTVGARIAQQVGGE